GAHHGVLLIKLRFLPETRPQKNPRRYKHQKPPTCQGSPSFHPVSPRTSWDARSDNNEAVRRNDSRRAELQASTYNRHDGQHVHNSHDHCRETS
ncbi:unnamed protein product, partial [Ectocarpus sp. 6 AP-2014]